MKNLLALILFVSFFSATAQDSVRFYVAAARQAQTDKRYQDFYLLIKKARTFHPYHREILYRSAIAAAVTDRKEEAVFFLRKALNINSGYDVQIPEFSFLHASPEFKKINDEITFLKKRVTRSDTAFVLKDRQLHIECIASGEKSDVFYLGSVYKRKIVRHSKSGDEDFSSGSDSLDAVMAIKIDKKKGILWATSSPLPEMVNSNDKHPSFVAKYDLKSRKLIAKYYSTNKAKDYVFGDLILDKTGMPIISDSRNNTIFKLNEKSGKLEERLSDKIFWNIQGIAFDETNRFLFVADYIKGIFRLDTSNDSLVHLAGDFNISLQSTDGLLYYDNSLIAIQNAITPMRVVRLYLNKDQSKFERYQLIDNDHPAFNEPTNGCIVSSDLYYVANSQWSGYENGKLKPTDKLQDIVILKKNLKK
jgi:hypothetical protein